MILFALAYRVSNEEGLFCSLSIQLLPRTWLGVLYTIDRFMSSISRLWVLRTRVALLLICLGGLERRWNLDWLVVLCFNGHEWFGQGRLTEAVLAMHQVF